MVHSPMYVRIIGVDHRIQWIPRASGLNWSSKIEQFITEICAQCKCHRLELVAEEFNPYLVKLNNAVDSTARRAATNLGIAHLFCDPTPEERERLPTADREGEWLRRLVLSGKTRILFICGDSHVDTFASNLVANGHSVEVVGRGWGVGWELSD